MLKGTLCQGCPRFAEKRCTPSELRSGTEIDVLIVGEQPDAVSAEIATPFKGHGGNIVRSAIKELQREPKYARLQIRFTYAVQCMATDDTSPSKKVMANCHTHLKSGILSVPPKVIVAMGSTAMKQLDFKLKHNDARGKFYTSFSYKAPVIITFSEKALLGNPGLYEVFKLDLKNAFEKIYESAKPKITLEELSKDYRLPTTVEDAIAVCEEIINYAPKGDPKDWAISVDTETTTLRPEKDDAKIIAFCFGWDKGKAATILYDHPNAPPEYLQRLSEIRAAIQKVLACNKPKILHNLKFDGKFILFNSGFEVNNWSWDTLLGEHLADEDKRGSYGLKALTAGWLPEYCGYEDKLYDLLTLNESISLSERADKEIADQETILQQDYPEYLQALKKHRDELSVYEVKYAEFSNQLEKYKADMAQFHADQQLWEQQIEEWRKAKEKQVKGEKRILKPKRFFPNKPSKPPEPRKPEKPEDPRTKKEQKISKDAGFEKVPLHDLQVYGAIDADVTRQLTAIQLRRISKEGSKVRPLMKSHAIPASLVLGRMEYYGTKVDQEYAEILGEGLRKVVQATEVELHNMVRPVASGDKAINLNHPATLANVLYSWGWVHPNGTRMSSYPIVEKTKKGQASTSEKALRPLVRYLDKDKEIPTDEAYFVERLLKYRKASKGLNTFLANLKALSRRDGYVHTQFHLNGTATARLSSSDMNLQNLPKYLAGWNIKKLLIPDNEDYVFVNVDWKGAEVRVFTAYARDTALIKALNDGLDMHSFFAHKVFKRPYDHYDNRENSVMFPDEKYRELLEEERSKIKRVVFGILYGAGPFKISETIGISIEEAKELIALLYEMFQAIEQYAIDVCREVDRNGYVETYFHRRRRFPLAHISRQRNRAHRQARNFKIQSTSSDIVIGQLIEIDEPLRKEFGGRLLLTVHDSLGFQFPKKSLDQLEEFVTYYAETRVKEKYPWLEVPFKVDIAVGRSYGECLPLNKYLANNPFISQSEGVVEEDELLNELREAPFLAQ